MLKIGQKLWWVDHEKKEEGYVIIADLCQDSIHVWYNGKRIERPYSVLGHKLFLTPQLSQATTKTARKATQRKTEPRPPYPLQYIQIKRKYPTSSQTRGDTEKRHRLHHAPTPNDTRSCDHCMLRKNETCTELSGQLCEDFRPIQYIPDDEMDAFPSYGDATAIRMRDRKRFREK